MNREEIKDLNWALKPKEMVEIVIRGPVDGGSLGGGVYMANEELAVERRYIDPALIHSIRRVDDEAGYKADRWAEPSPEMREVPAGMVLVPINAVREVLDFEAIKMHNPCEHRWECTSEGGAQVLQAALDAVSRPASPPLTPEVALRGLVAALKDPNVSAITATDDVRGAWSDALRVLDGQATP